MGNIQVTRLTVKWLKIKIYLVMDQVKIRLGMVKTLNPLR
jgi:hypothetical protein